MEKVIKYRCLECGELFDTPEKALAHEIRHERIKKANEMLNEGYTLKQINDECEIWYFVPKHLENVNRIIASKSIIGNVVINLHIELLISFLMER